MAVKGQPKLRSLAAVADVRAVADSQLDETFAVERAP